MSLGPDPQVEQYLTRLAQNCEKAVRSHDPALQEAVLVNLWATLDSYIDVAVAARTAYQRVVEKEGSGNDFLPGNFHG